VSTVRSFTVISRFRGGSFLHNFSTRRRRTTLVYLCEATLYSIPWWIYILKQRNIIYIRRVSQPHR
jgi:hypothetical protein